MTRERSEIDEKYKWNLEDIYSSRSGWEEDREKLEKKASKIQDFKGSIDDSPEKLLKTLELKFEISEIAGKLSRYASMKADQNLNEEEWQELSSISKSVISEAMSQLSFIVPEIQEMGQEKIDSFLDQNEELREYEHYLDDLMRSKPYTLSHEVENVVSKLSDVLGSSSQAYMLLSNADIQFPTVEKDGEELRITQSNYTKFMQHKDREFREQVYQKYYSTLSGFKNTIGANLANTIKKEVKMADIRGYNSSRHAALHDSNIDPEIYDNLVKIAGESTDQLQRHIELKRKTLDVETVESWDIYAPITEDVEIEYDEACKMVIEAVAPLGKEYQDKVKEAFEEGWIDAFENKGKRSGGYQSDVYDTHPFILMNFQNDVSSVYTLIHEMGHAMHSHLSNTNQPYVYSNYDIFVAETASKVNELLLTEYLLDQEDEKLKKRVLEHSLDNFRGTFFRQTMFAHFEQNVHEKMAEKGALTAEGLSREYESLKQEYYGKEDFDDLMKYEWMRIPHFQRSPFYVYKYSTGRAAAQILFQKIMEEGPEDYLEFLKTGSREYSLEALEKAGVDMRESEPYRAAVKDYRERIGQLEKQL